MITVRVKGGLGNQMFQYAAALGLADKYGTSIELDLSHYDQPNSRAFMLDLYHVNYSVKQKSSDCPFYRLTQKIIRRLGLASKDRVYLEKEFCYDTAFSSLPDGIALDGYFQTEKYFSHIRQKLLEQFHLKNPSSTPNQVMLKKIQSCNAVSLHIRRGDYITNPAANEVHGLCDLSYYDLVIKKILEAYGDAHFFVFSDDVDWAKKNLNINPVTFVDINDESTGFEDLKLMSHCQHHIIANSSFSWWGAWLNSSKNKMVYAPKKWFKNSSNDTKDLLPDSWVAL